MPGHRNSSAPPTGDLLAVLGDAQHLLIIGPSRSGKTSLVHELARRWRTQAALVVLDPDAAPGLWPGCEVFGAGDDFAGIDTALHALQTELEERRRQRARGVRRFAPVRVIMSEAADLMANCAHARPVFAGILRCCTRVCANASGEENRRFLSNLSTNSLATCSAWSPVRCSRNCV